MNNSHIKWRRLVLYFLKMQSISTLDPVAPFDETVIALSISFELKASLSTKCCKFQWIRSFSKNRRHWYCFKSIFFLSKTIQTHRSNSPDQPFISAFCFCFSFVSIHIHKIFAICAWVVIVFLYKCGIWWVCMYGCEYDIHSQFFVYLLLLLFRLTLTPNYLSGTVIEHYIFCTHSTWWCTTQNIVNFDNRF